MEAWAWLEREGILIRDPNQPAPLFFISRRGQRMRSQQDFEAYRKAGLLPKSQLHPLIAAKVYPAFLRGEYDTAIFQAFREVEVAVRAAGGFPADLAGVNLMREALRPVKNTARAGPLTDTLLPVAEQEGMASLFAGAILLYKNPQSHRNVPADAADAAEVIGFASHLLRMVDRRKAGKAIGSTMNTELVITEGPLGFAPAGTMPPALFLKEARAAERFFDFFTANAGERRLPRSEDPSPPARHRGLDTVPQPSRRSC
jgi:uncharacterized protein (TIGR02391 family)